MTCCSNVIVWPMGVRTLELFLIGTLTAACGDTEKSSAFDVMESTAESGDSAGSTSSTSGMQGSGTTATTSSGGASSSSSSSMTSGGRATSASTGASVSSGGAAGAEGNTDASNSDGTAVGGAGGETTLVEGSVDIADSCAFTACGGELAATDWQYSRICIQEQDLLGLVSSCPELDLLDSSGNINGTLSFDDTTFERNVNMSITAVFLLPPSCVVGNCEATGLAVASLLPGAVCADNAGACTCSVTLDGSDSTSGEYSQSGSQLSLEEETASYCRSSNKLEYTGTFDGVPFVAEALPY
jgi:hypothetical protein